MSGLTDPSEGLRADPTTWLITRRPRPDKVAKFERVLSDTIHAALAFPGHLGVTVLRPAGASGGEYRLIVKFASEEALRGWRDSPEAARWFARIEALEERPGRFEVATGLESWFVLPPDDVPGRPPLLGRGAMLLTTWVAAYPVLTLLLMLLGPFIGGWPLALRTLVLSGLMVALLTYVVMPALVRILAPALFQRTRSAG
jgi:antibiotic biosynthesis monooxygenase (ABM) superfamily enzyme